MIEVTGCRILVQPLTVEENDEVVRSAKRSGLVLLESDERKTRAHMDKGVVLQLGPRCSDEYVAGVRVGDTIGFTKFGGKFVRDFGSDVDVLVINDEDVICIFKESK